MKIIKIRQTTTHRLEYPIGSDMPEIIKMAKEAAEKFDKIKAFKNKTVNVVCRGSSGAILAALFVAHCSNLSRFYIRHIKKDNEDSHTLNNSSLIKDAIVLVIDDFISSGITMSAIYKALKYHKVTKVDCLIVDSGYRTYEDGKGCCFKPDYLITRDVR